jgi:hypothetical protein
VAEPCFCYRQCIIAIAVNNDNVTVPNQKCDAAIRVLREKVFNLLSRKPAAPILESAYHACNGLPIIGCRGHYG